jgi:glycosyltransferase involved in cell wall biosynthesis
VSPGDRPRRILHVIACFGAGGAEQVARLLITRQLAAGNALALAAAPGFLDASLPAGVARYRLVDRGRSPAGALLEIRALARVLRSFEPTVVHTHGARMLALTLAARRLASGGRRPPILATHHATAPEEQRRSARILRRADHVVCVSEALRERMALAGIPRARMSVVYNAVEPSPATDAQGAALDAELGLAGHSVVSLVGRLEAQKRPCRFVEVAAAVSERHADARFVVVGDGSLRPRAQDHARALGLEQRMRFTGSRPDARAITARSSVLVFTSSWEGLSIAALEALAAGVPVVATDTDGMRELLSEGAGVVVGEDTVEALAREIGDLLSDPQRGRELGRRGRALVGARFTVEEMVAGYQAAYLRAGA